MPHPKFSLRRGAAWAVIVATLHRILVWALFYICGAGFVAGKDMRSTWTAAAFLDYPVFLMSNSGFPVVDESGFRSEFSLDLFVSLGWSVIIGLVAAALIFCVKSQLRRCTSGPVVGLGIVGLLIGGFVAFLLRPAIPLIGKQLPFEHVITRGANLERIDQILAPLAQRSFNMMLAGAILGAVTGALVGFFISQRRPSTRKIETDDSISLGK